MVLPPANLDLICRPNILGDFCLVLFRGFIFSLFGGDDKWVCLYLSHGIFLLFLLKASFPFGYLVCSVSCFIFFITTALEIMTDF